MISIEQASRLAAAACQPPVVISHFLGLQAYNGAFRAPEGGKIEILLRRRPGKLKPTP
jgi:hypothetical protein